MYNLYNLFTSNCDNCRHLLCCVVYHCIVLYCVALCRIVVSGLCHSDVDKRKEIANTQGKDNQPNGVEETGQNRPRITMRSK